MAPNLTQVYERERFSPCGAKMAGAMRMPHAARALGDTGEGAISEKSKFAGNSVRTR